MDQPMCFDYVTRH